MKKIVVLLILLFTITLLSIQQKEVEVQANQTWTEIAYITNGSFTLGTYNDLLNAKNDGKTLYYNSNGVQMMLVAATSRFDVTISGTSIGYITRYEISLGSNHTGSIGYYSTITQYTVIFKDWDETTLKTETVISGNNATPPSNPIRSGYTFTGWSGTYTNVTSNLTITAQYTVNLVNTYSVTFKDWDGSIIKIHIVPDGYDAIPPSDPIRDGYIFIGWSGTYTNVTSDRTVTAQYSKGIFYVTFKDYDGTTIKTVTVMNGTIDLYSQNGWDELTESELYLWGFISSIDNKFYITGKTVQVTQNINYQAVLSETLPRTYEDGYADAMAQEDFSFWEIALSSLMLPFTILSIELMPGLPIGIFALIPIVFGLIAFFFSFKGGKK